jgi:anti-sigma28 factor (negative regulator of flagellin synthesis)
MSNINRINISNLGVDRAGSVQRRDDVKPADAGQSPVQRDSIELSGKVKTMDRLAGLVQQSRSDRLDEIRQKLEANTYSVSSADIARKLIECSWR